MIRGYESDYTNLTSATDIAVAEALKLRDERHKTTQDESIEHLVATTVDQSIKKLLKEITNPLPSATDTVIQPEYGDSTSASTEVAVPQDSGADADDTEDMLDDALIQKDVDYDIDDDLEEMLLTDVPMFDVNLDDKVTDDVIDRLESHFQFKTKYKYATVMADTNKFRENKIRGYKEVLAKRFSSLVELIEYLIQYAETYLLDPRIYLMLKFLYTEPHPWNYIMDDDIFGYYDFFFKENPGKNELDTIIHDLSTELMSDQR